jgi:hypothetical protein
MILTSYLVVLSLCVVCTLLFHAVQPTIVHAVVVSIQDEEGLIVYQGVHVFTSPDAARQARDKLHAKLGTGDPSTVFLSQNITLDQGPL